MKIFIPEQIVLEGKNNAAECAREIFNPGNLGLFLLKL